MKSGYPITVFRDEDGSLRAVFADIPGGASAETNAELRVRARECLETVLGTMIRDNRDIPLPGRARGRAVIHPGITLAAKVAIHRSMRHRGLRLRDMARRLGCADMEMRRILDPDHRTKIPTLERALHVLGWGARLTIVEDRDSIPVSAPPSGSGDWTPRQS